MRIKSGNRGNSAKKRSGSKQKDSGPKAPPTKPKAPLPEWNSMHSDLTAYKLSDSELLKRKAERTSKNHLAAKSDWREKIEKLASGEHVEPPANLSSAQVDHPWSARGPAVSQKGHSFGTKDRNNSRERSREATGRIASKLTGDKLISHIDDSLAKTKQLLEAIERGDISTAMNIHTSVSSATKAGLPKPSLSRKDLDLSESSKLSRSTLNEETLNKADKLNEEIRALLKKYAPQDDVDKPQKNTKKTSLVGGDEDEKLFNNRPFAETEPSGEDPMNLWGNGRGEQTQKKAGMYSETLSETDKEEFGLKKLDDLLYKGNYDTKLNHDLEYQSYPHQGTGSGGLGIWTNSPPLASNKELAFRATQNGYLEVDPDLKFEPLDSIFGEAKELNFLGPQDLENYPRQDGITSLKPHLDHKKGFIPAELTDPFGGIDSSAILKPDHTGGNYADASRLDALSGFLGKPSSEEDADTSKEMSMLVEDDEYLRKLKGILQSTHDDMKRMDTAWQPTPSKIPPNNIKELARQAARAKEISAPPENHNYSRNLQKKMAAGPIEAIKEVQTHSKSGKNGNSFAFSNLGEDMDEFERIEAQVDHDSLPRRIEPMQFLPKLVGGRDEDSDEGIIIEPSKPLQVSKTSEDDHMRDSQTLTLSGAQGKPSGISAGITSYYSLIPRKMGQTTVTKPAPGQNPSRQVEPVPTIAKRPVADQPRPQPQPQMAYWASDKAQHSGTAKNPQNGSAKLQIDRGDDDDDELCLKKQIRGAKKQFGL